MPQIHGFISQLLNQRIQLNFYYYIVFICDNNIDNKSMMWKIIQINTLNLICLPATSVRHDGFVQLMDSLDIKVRLVHTIKYQLWYKIQLNMNTELNKFNLSKLLIWFSCSSIPYNFFIDFSNMGSISVKFTYSISEPINSFISVIPLKKLLALNHCCDSLNLRAVMFMAQPALWATIVCGV